MASIEIALILSLLAGLSTGIGGLIAYFIKSENVSYLSVITGFSAGVMIYISFVELLGEAIEGLGFLWSNLSFFSGIIILFLIDRLIPHAHEDMSVDSYCGDEDFERRRLMKCGLLVAAGVAIHNFPEGLAVLFSSIKSLSLGIPVAFAIALHNIPEGIAVSVPIYYATQSEKKAFGYSILSGIFEPIGAVVGYLILFSFITPLILDAVLALVAGMMVFISFDELIPVSREYGSEHLANLGLFLGMVAMVASIYLLP